MDAFLGSHSHAKPSPASSPDGARPRVVTYPDGLADLIAETLRLRAMSVTISQTIVATLDHVEKLQRNYASLLKRCRARRAFVKAVRPTTEDSDDAGGRWGGPRPASERGIPRRPVAGPARARDARALDRARLEGAILLARTAAHLINNDLTTTVILDQMIRTQVERGERVDPRLLDQAIAAARRAARHLIRLQRITHLDVQSGYGDSPPVLDLRHSRARKSGVGPGPGSISESRRRYRRRS